MRSVDYVFYSVFGQVNEKNSRQRQLFMKLILLYNLERITLYLQPGFSQVCRQSLPFVSRELLKQVILQVFRYVEHGNE